MRIYNKKGFIFGLIWTMLGIWLLINAFTAQESVTKDIMLAFILLAVGITSVCRAISKTASLEDYIEKNDERNKLIELKTKSRVLDLMVAFIIILMIIGITGYIITDNLSWGFIFFEPLLMFGFYWIVSIIVEIYYERKE